MRKVAASKQYIWCGVWVSTRDKRSAALSYKSWFQHRSHTSDIDNTIGWQWYLWFNKAWHWLRTPPLLFWLLKLALWYSAPYSCFCFTPLVYMAIQEYLKDDDGPSGPKMKCKNYSWKRSLLLGWRYTNDVWQWYSNLYLLQLGKIISHCVKVRHDMREVIS